MSKMRKSYLIRLVGRMGILIGCICLCIWRPESLHIIEKGRFLDGFSILHLLWIIWMVDMLFQLIPVKKSVPLGSQKHFSLHFRATAGETKYQGLHDYIAKSTGIAYVIFAIWCVMLAILGVLHRLQVIKDTALFMISVFFFVCDLICVLIWCPFRLMLGNQCCTTCRIFNWDHIMMFSPMIYVNSFFAHSLIIAALLVWLVWEVSVMTHPERFWQGTNKALQCSQCTNKLCTQRCGRPVKSRRNPGSRDSR